VEIALIMALTLAIIITATVASVRAEEVNYVTPRIPSDKEKTEALQLGYILNGFSMVRSPRDGSIDVTKGFDPNLSLTPPPGVVRTIPIVPTKKKDRDR
jgi:hypothetical protein